MSARIEDGGPAFPFIEPPTECNVSEGMSLRDYFAAKAMTALFAHLEAIDKVAVARGVSAEEAVAVDAYLMADAMLKARAAS